MEDRPKAATIDEYIAGFPPDIQAKLQEVRETVRQAAPEAAETMSYAMPAFTLSGVLVYFAAFKSHIGFYPTPRGVEEFDAELAPYKAGKGSLRFPLDRPLPRDLIARIVKFRAEENGRKAAYRSR